MEVAVVKDRLKVQAGQAADSRKALIVDVLLEPRVLEVDSFKESISRGTWELKFEWWPEKRGLGRQCYWGDTMQVEFRINLSPLLKVASFQ